MKNIIEIAIGGAVDSSLSTSLWKAEGAVKQLSSNVRAVNRAVSDVSAYKELRQSALGTALDLRKAKHSLVELGTAANTQANHISELEDQLAKERKGLAAANAVHKERKQALSLMRHELLQAREAYKANHIRLQAMTKQSKEQIEAHKEEKQALQKLEESYKIRVDRLKANSRSLTTYKDKIKKSSDELKEQKLALRELQKGATGADRNIRALTGTFERQKDSLSRTEAKLKSQGLAVRALATEEKRLAVAADRANASLLAAQKLDSKLSRNRSVLNSAPGQIMSTAYTALQVGAPALAAASFESSQSSLKALANSDNKISVPELSELAMSIGRDSQLKYSSIQAMDAMRYMAMAGSSNADIKGSIKDTLKLAMAGGVDTGYAADIGTNIMSAFGLKGGENMRAVGNVLTKAFTSHNLDLTKISETMRYVGPLAGMLHVKDNDKLSRLSILEQMSSMAGILGNKGIDSSTAGTGLRKIITSFASPTGAAKEYLATQGIDTKDKEGNLRSIDEVFKDLSIAIENDGTADKAEILKKIFGEEALSSATALTEAAGSGELSKSIAKVKDSAGVMDKIARIKMDNTIGAFENLKSSAMGAGIEIGKVFLPVIKSTLDIMSAGVNAVGSVAKTFPALTFVVTGAATAITGLKIATLGYNIVRAVFSDGLVNASKVLRFFTGVELGASAVTKGHTATTLAQTIVTKASTLACGIHSRAIMLYTGLTTGATTVTGLFTGALRVLKLAFATNPVGMFVVGVTSALALCYTKIDWFKEKLSGVGDWLRDFALSATNLFGLLDDKAGAVRQKIPAVAAGITVSATPMLAANTAKIPNPYEIPAPLKIEQKTTEANQLNFNFNLQGVDQKKSSEIADEMKKFVTDQFKEMERKRRIDEKRKLMDRSKGGMF